jgi:putative nucleotidyltransferase with HDIG domain
MTRAASGNLGTRDRADGQGVGARRRDALREAGERWLVNSPERGWTVLIAALMAILIAGTLVFMQRQILLAPGQVMSEARAARVELRLNDEQATARARESARERAARVYAPDEKVLSGVLASLLELPSAARSSDTVESLPSSVSRDFSLTPEELNALRQVPLSGPGAVRWAEMATAFVERVRRVPVVSTEVLADERRGINRAIELRLAGEGYAVNLATGEVLGVTSGEWARKAAELAADAGFGVDVRAAVVRRVSVALKMTPLTMLDVEATKSNREAAAAGAEIVTTTFRPGHLIYARGDVLSGEQIRLATIENNEYWESNRNPVSRLHDAAAVVLAAVFSLGVVLSIATFAPQISSSQRKLGVVCGMIVAALVAGCALAIAEPRLVMMASVAPAVFVAMVLAIAYDRRVALAIGAVLVVLSCVALDQGAVQSVVGLVGVVVSVRSLREVRVRPTLVIAALWAGAAVMVVGPGVGLLARPVMWDAVRQSMLESAIASVAVMLCGFVILGLVPVIERVFGVTTGLTLIELRDPSHPLLRQLQQRAPGTYNHSLNVAALAEAAATAIHADSLLAFVGALYHDVGKMNKPEYFVENQTPGFNRHERLTPAMSLLVIVGHVKDGVELSREHRLPASIEHFIESHHGTTLVEYFFHRARKQAETARLNASDEPGMEPATPQEIEYRYPGPKPRSREAAILMVCDASESAARAMSDPSPMRIDALVRAIAHKRLMDGQFDQSDLTLSELTTVIEAVSRSLSSIHHQRIQYPEPAKPVSAVAAAGATA